MGVQALTLKGKSIEGERPQGYSRGRSVVRVEGMRVRLTKMGTRNPAGVERVTGVLASSSPRQE